MLISYIFYYIKTVMTIADGTKVSKNIHNLEILRIYNAIIFPTYSTLTQGLRINNKN